MEELQKAPTGDQSPINGLNDKLLRYIFAYLDTKEIGRCARVSPKWKTIAYERWESVILDELQVPFKFIGQILKMGTKYLSLENTHLLHEKQADIGLYYPDFNDKNGYYDLPKDHHLEYLNLSLDSSSLDDMARYHDFDLKWGLLASCNHLEKLALGDIEAAELVGNIFLTDLLDGEDINDILESAATLKVFQMAFNQEEIPLRAFKKLVTNLTELTDLNLKYEKASKATVDFLCKNLSPKLKKISLVRMNITDENIGDLLTRCKDLTELAVYDCKSLTSNVVDHVLVGRNLTTLTLPDKI